ncbi:MAG: asparagine synthase-related protein [Pseudomonadota bacterium]
MSGFAVLLAHREASAGAAIDDRLLTSLADALRYRGPDAAATLRDGPAGFAVACLSPDAGSTALPECDPSGGAVYGAMTRKVGCIAVGDVCFDGFGDVARRSTARNDLDTLVARYRASGLPALTAQRGEFALALWDAQAGRLLLQRDRFGVKPLYLARTTHFWIASNTFSVVRRFCSGRINDRAVGQFLLHGLNPELDSTGFADIALVPPGTILALAPGSAPKRVATQPLDVPEVERGLDADDIDAMLRPALEAAVSDRIGDATDITVALSGGLDSGCVAAAAQAVRDHSSTSLRALAMDDSALVASADEANAAAQSARQLQIPMVNLTAARWAPVDPRELPSSACPPEPSMSMPGNRYGHTPTRATVGDVLLTGHCGDAVWVPNRDYFWRALGNVRWFGLARDWTASLRFTGALPPVFVRSGLLYRNRNRTLPIPPWLRADFVERVDLPPPTAPATAPSDRDGRRTDALESLRSPVWPRLFEHLDAGLDRGAPVPIRHPWLDHRVLDVCLKLPSVPWCLDKLAVRLTLARDLDPAIARRPKAVVPQQVEQNALRTFFATLGPELLADGLIDPYVDTGRLQRLLGQVERLRPHEYALLARPLYLAYWLRQVANSSGRRPYDAAGVA